MADQADFQTNLLATAARIAAESKAPEVDSMALWKAFLFLAHTGDAEAQGALAKKFGDKNWLGAFPKEVGSSGEAVLPIGGDVKRLIGPLSPLSKKYGGVLTPSNFLAVLEEANTLAEIGVVEVSAPPGKKPESKDIPASPPPALGGSPAGDAGGSRGKQKPPAPAASASDSRLASALDCLQDRLETNVFGQTSAVRAFVDGLRTALDRPVSDGLLGGSFLICGPHGSGKSELIHILDEWVAQHKDSLRVKSVIYCEGYLQSVLYTLRDRIRQSSPSIIVLNEFEKYEEEVRDVLMEGMDRAVLQLPDKGIGGKLETTNIKGWIIILVGNVARALWGRLPFKEKEILPDRERVKELIEQEAIADRHHKSDIFQRNLSRAFLDRIDYFIPLCQLRYADVARILEREVGKLQGEVRQKGQTLEVEPRVLDLVLLASYYKRGWSARQALRGFKEHIEGPVRGAGLRYGMKPVQMVSMDKAFNKALKQGVPKILVIDDEWESVCKVLAAGLGTRAEVMGAPDIKQGLEMAIKGLDLMLLDLYFSDKLLWKDYLATWRGAQPEVPVVLFSQRVVSSTDRLEIDRLGGVLGFVEKSASAEAMVRSVEPFLAHAAWQAKIRSFEKEYGYGGDRVLFDTRVTSDDKGITIRFSDVHSVVTDGTVVETEDPVLPSETRHEIDEFLDLFLDVRKRAALKIDQPKGLLLYGPPGNGKTMVARSIARWMRCNFLAVAASDFQSRWAGVASERLKELFEQARMRQPCVLFIDEIDAVAPHRQEDSGGGVLRDQASTVATLLTELDGFGGSSDVFVIGATNRKEALDESLLRPGRMDRVIQVTNPGLGERKTLLERALGKISTDKVDVAWAAAETFGMSAAQIVRAVQDGVIVALRRTKRTEGAEPKAPRVTKDDMREAIDRLRYGARPGQGSPEAEALKDSREMTAWHEAGHLILSMTLLGEIPNRVTIVPRGEYSGFVRHSEEDLVKRMGARRRSSCLAEIGVCLAGGLAEEIRFGEHTSGVASDRQAAMRLAHAMIVRWGMGSADAEVGAFLASGGLGREGSAVLGVVSAVDQKAVAEAVTGLVKEAADLAKRELEQHRQELEQAASLLLEREELDKADIANKFGRLAKKATAGRSGAEKT